MTPARHHQEKNRDQIRRENKLRARREGSRKGWSLFPRWLMPRELADVINRAECDE
jgi:hypothetical protein